MKKTEKRVSSIATRTGDKGETSLLFGKRVLKNHPQVEAAGALDELSSVLGFAKATCSSEEGRKQLEQLQRDLIAFSGEISTPPEAMERFRKSQFAKIEEEHLARLDRELAEAEQQTSLPKDWAFPGSNLHEAALEMARSTARRAERGLVSLRENGFPLRPLLLQYLNRLSDLLWILARKAG